jgi:hypothetical protein
MSSRSIRVMKLPVNQRLAYIAAASRAPLRQLDLTQTRGEGNALVRNGSIALPCGCLFTGPP